MPEVFSHRFEHIDENMMKVEVNLDDMTGEMLGYVMEKLIAVGANDVFYVPIYMKKNRPAVMLQLLCDKTKLDFIKEILFEETTTLGIRYFPLSVHRLERYFRKVSIAWGDVAVKIGMYQGKLVQASPEFEDCKAIAKEHGVPLKDIYKKIWEQLGYDESH